MKMDSDHVLSDVWLRGEISNFTHHSSGHMYFTLKDKDSRIKCVMFASHNARLRFIPKEGAKVLAQGTISVYERDGAYQFYANAMQPDGLRSEEHTSELQSRENLVCRLQLEKKK